MASQVPHSNTPLPAGRTAEKAAKELETPLDYKETFKNRSTVSKYADPCEAASKASMSCLERAHYNRNECMDYFRAYRECKKAWMEQMKKDKRKAWTG
ncbi:cytochrome c oxidase-assembly factor COX23, mitochondrial [Papiliotrema laurentii]|uniref:Cytochrome c oxidase-assembly factor COX23, mitochondrial n=1 Tax=Papiliotrema laurentii TaxID=5418 RepID=A0AAD9CUY9_PAPLA|nr:cytochrome c oxidase-assembly factor COX23, mitochondrial [Papiliotrema laurentii]